jgi:hypothetical protein
MGDVTDGRPADNLYVQLPTVSASLVSLTD